MRIVLISPMLQPYRVQFYTKLASLFDDFTVYHGVKVNEDGRPAFTLETKFKNIGFIETKFNILNFNVVRNQGMFEQITFDNPDVIISQGIPGNLTYRRIVRWAKDNNKILIFWYCGWEPNMKRNKFLGIIKNYLKRSFYNGANHYITYGTWAKKLLISEGISETRISVAFNGIDIDTYEAREHVKPYDISRQIDYSNQVKYLYVGGLIEEKRILFLIEVFKKFSMNNTNCVLKIIGDGPQRQIVEESIKTSSNIYYLGRIYDSVDEYFEDSDFFILPGTGGLALNQAMANTTVCICGTADGTEDDLIVDGLTGLRFESDNPVSLMSALERTLQLTPSDIQSMRGKARSLILTRSNVDRMVNVFAEAINGLKG
jgi:glycosyltransferase involved in cell wall biosynthesis